MPEEKDYENSYGDIPVEYYDRLEWLIQETKYKRPKVSIFDRIQEILNIPWKTITFTIYLVPKPTPRPRFTSKGNFFYVVGAKNNKKYFRKFMRDYDWEVIYTPCIFQVNTYYPIPASMQKQEKLLAEMGYVYPISKPDWDNVGKTYSDMIQGILLYDDSLITEGISKKFYSAKPRIEITLRYMERFDSVFNEKKMKKKLEKG